VKPKLEKEERGEFEEIQNFFASLSQEESASFEREAFAATNSFKRETFERLVANGSGLHQGIRWGILMEHLERNKSSRS
jgi:hypothetical protein